MKRFHLAVLAFFLFNLLSQFAFAVTISGKVTGAANEPLAFANVYVKGTSNGTTTNLDGFYKLEVPEGIIEIIFRYVGYKTRNEKINISGVPVVLDIQLEQQEYTLGEISVKADAEDPAYAIIRKAIEKRKFYLQQVDEFSCKVYIKGIQKFTKYPEKFLGVDVNLSEFVDSTTGIIYLSESVSEYNFKKPDQVKEIMISSKVSGSNRAFSFNQASDMEFNFYENVMDVSGLSPRGFISPIASSALFYYRYRLEGSFYENGHWVNKIKVTPKRKSDPVFSGYIYIQDSLWRIHSTDLYLTKDSQMEFVDTLKVNQVFIPASENDDIWMQGSVTLTFYFGALGFEGNGNFVAVFSEYNLSPGFDKKYFTGMVMKVNEDSNDKDSSYWEKNRPVPLTQEETRDYIKKDSLAVVRESKPYLDSLDKANNKFSFSDLIGGYSYSDRYHKREYSFSSLLQNIQFNTVEGLNAGIAASVEKNYEDRRSVTTGVHARYGFSNEKLSASANVHYIYNRKKHSYLTVEAGDDLVQFNANAPISPLINTSYTLLAEKNYMKLYRKQYGFIKSGRELINGVRLGGTIEYATRSAVQNTTDYKLVDKDNRDYSSNNPLNPYSEQFLFKTNNSLKVLMDIRLRIRQKYIDRPDVNYIIGSKYPEFIFSYLKGIKAAFTDVDFDKIEVGVQDQQGLGMFGTFNYYGVYGKYLNNNKLYFTDATHFNGNQTFFSGFEMNRFDLLEYYKYSTADEYIQVFTEHEFGGFILNKLPLLRKLKLNEVAGFRFLHVPGFENHYEASIGLQKLGFIRADFVMAFEKGKTKTGFVIGVKGIIR
jgi:hypothetical protein